MKKTYQTVERLKDKFNILLDKNVKRPSRNIVVEDNEKADSEEKTSPDENVLLKPSIEIHRNKKWVKKVKKKKTTKKTETPEKTVKTVEKTEEELPEFIEVKPEEEATLAEGTVNEQEFIPVEEEEPQVTGDITEEDLPEWEPVEEKERKAKKFFPKKRGLKGKKIKGFRYKNYGLYKKEIKTKQGNVRVVRFFSKQKPADAMPIDLPNGFVVKVNKSTGLPYLKKKKQQKKI